MTLQTIKSRIRDVPNYPKEGILFKDITPLLGDGLLFKESVQMVFEPFKEDGIQGIVGIESRGFIFGAACAYHLSLPFIPVRKKGKLPYKTMSESYELEYGTDILEIHDDAIPKGQKILVVDDLLATGGTARAVLRLIEKVGGINGGLAFLIELDFLKGREKFPNTKIHSLIHYE